MQRPETRAPERRERGKSTRTTRVFAPRRCETSGFFVSVVARRDARERTAVDSPSIPHHATTQDQTTEIARKKKRSVKTNNRSIVGASLEVIQKKRAEKSDVRAAARDAALREIKERQRKAKDAKKGKK